MQPTGILVGQKRTRTAVIVGGDLLRKTSHVARLRVSPEVEVVVTGRLLMGQIFRGVSHFINVVQLAIY